MFAIVEFLEEETIDIIAQAWFTCEEETSCYWPPRKAAELAQKLTPPSSVWGKHAIRVLGKAGKRKFKLNNKGPL